MKTTKKHKGFTLIELIIMIVVLGLLAGLAVPKFIGIARDAQVATLIQDIDTLEKVIPVYYTKHEEYPLHMDNPIAFKNDSPLFLALQKNGESGEKIYKVDLNKTKPYHSKLKYGYSGASDDCFIYSMDTGRVYYAKGIMNGDGKYVYGHDIESKYTLRNLTLSNIPIVHKTMEVEGTEHTLSGEVLINEIVTITHNGNPILVEYEDILARSNLVNIYAGESKYKKFTASLLLETSQQNKIEVSTSKETEIFTINIKQDQPKSTVVETQIVAGEYHNLALKEDSTVWAWGQNTYGQLGDGTTERRYTPVQVQELSNVKQVSTGTYHSLVLKKDGTVWAWGYNKYGQLGDGTSEDKYTPVQVPNLSNIKQVAAGNGYSLALRTDGTVWAWGLNWSGQCGNGTTTNCYTPVQVHNLFSVKQVTTGGGHNLAILEDGTVWAWGRNDYGECGDGTTGASRIHRIPVQVKNLSDVKQVAGGYQHSLALKADGTVWTWGDNSRGQLGDGTTEEKHTPVQIQNLFNVEQIATGFFHNIAVLKDGTVWGWGLNASGHLDKEKQSYIYSPVQISTLYSVKQMTAGKHHSLALLKDGTVMALGSNRYGQLGDGTNKNQVTPVQVQFPN